MKVLVVVSGNWKIISPFVEEQVNSIQEKNIEIDYYLIKGRKLIYESFTIGMMGKEFEKNL
ncbi:MAG: hypothetical protein ABSD71_05840 [Bacteroidales bacterium]|jgi:hypothetical protein